MGLLGWIALGTQRRPVVSAAAAVLAGYALLAATPLWLSEAAGRSSFLIAFEALGLVVFGPLAIAVCRCSPFGPAGDRKSNPLPCPADRQTWFLILWLGLAFWGVDLCGAVAQQRAAEDAARYRQRGPVGHVVLLRTAMLLTPLYRPRHLVRIYRCTDDFVPQHSAQSAVIPGGRQFAAPDRDFLRGFDPQPDRLATDFEDGHRDPITDHDALAFFAGKDKHIGSSMTAGLGRRRLCVQYFSPAKPRLASSLCMAFRPSLEGQELKVLLFYRIVYVCQLHSVREESARKQGGMGDFAAREPPANGRRELARAGNRGNCAPRLPSAKRY